VEYFMVDEPYINLSRASKVYLPAELVQVEQCRVTGGRCWTVSFFVREGMGSTCVVRLQRWRGNVGAGIGHGTEMNEKELVGHGSGGIAKGLHEVIVNGIRGRFVATSDLGVDEDDVAGEDDGEENPFVVDAGLRRSESRLSMVSTTSSMASSASRLQEAKLKSMISGGNGSSVRDGVPVVTSVLDSDGVVDSMKS
jgi:hypothetical protein